MVMNKDKTQSNDTILYHIWFHLEQLLKSVVQNRLNLQILIALYQILCLEESIEGQWQSLKHLCLFLNHHRMHSHIILNECIPNILIEFLLWFKFLIMQFLQNLIHRQEQISRPHTNTKNRLPSNTITN